MTLFPTFQPQNPAINGYALGWASCTCYAGAMAGSYDAQVAKLVTGEQVRRRTGDTQDGTNLAQVDQALQAWRVDLDVEYRLAWSSFASRINAGQAAVLQVWYAPIADSRFDAGRGFRGNHAILVLPGWVVMDPLADGRASGVYKYHGEAYPQTLLKDAAGKLNVAPIGYSTVGAGLVYAAFTRDNTKTYRLQINPGAAFIYTFRDGKIWSRKSVRFTAKSGAPCLPPRRFYPHASGPLAGTPSRILGVVSAGYLEGKGVGDNPPVTDIVEFP